MTDKVFVDTNVLVYCRDASEPSRQKQALAWMDHLWKSRAGRISFQVLSEFYVTVTNKLDPGMGRERARDDIRLLQAWRPVALNAPIVKGAWRLEDRYSLSWWDALIVSAALAAGCRYLLTEDLQPGQDLDGVQVISPFESTPG